MFETSVDAGGGGRGHGSRGHLERFRRPSDSEMINQFSTKEHKGRLVKSKQGTEDQPPGPRGSSV